MKALAMSNFKKANRQHLRDTGNLGYLVFPSPIFVPYLWARRDYRGHKAVIKVNFGFNKLPITIRINSRFLFVAAHFI